LYKVTPNWGIFLISFRPIFSVIESIVALFVSGLNLIKTSLAAYSVSAVLHEKDKERTIIEKKKAQKKSEDGSIPLPAFCELKRNVIIKSTLDALFDYTLTDAL
jgi:hypothetical protein